MIIGITGTLSAGKGTIADLLIQKGFKHYSVRYFLTQEIKQRGLEVNRDNMVKIANELREKNSPNYIVENLYDKAKKAGGDCIIESIRNPGEVEALKSKGGFHLIAVDANVKLRYERAIARASSTDKISFEEFIANEQREIASKELHKQNLSKCVEMADFVIINNGGLEELKARVEEIIKEVNVREHRPLWDEYFIKVAALVAERSTCLRHHVGAIIVKDKKIITTGYNGAAKGIKDCLERGCLRDELGIASGTRHEICRAIHAEQNAIIQGAYHGTSIKGGIMYCTHTPCIICAKMIVNAGIKEIVSYQDYADKDAKKLLQEAGINLKKIAKPISKISFKD